MPPVPSVCLLSALSAVPLCIFCAVPLYIFCAVSLCIFCAVSLCIFCAVSLCILCAVSLCILCAVSLCILSFLCAVSVYTFSVLCVCVHSPRRVSVFSESSLCVFFVPCLCLLITVTASLCSINAWCLLLQLQPWKMKAEKQELCKSCENFGLHKNGLNDVFKLLEEELKDGALDAEAVPNDEHGEVLKLYVYLHIEHCTN